MHKGREEGLGNYPLSADTRKNVFVIMLAKQNLIFVGFLFKNFMRFLRLYI